MKIDLTQLIEETTTELLDAEDIIKRLSIDVLEQLDKDVQGAVTEFNNSNPEYRDGVFEATLVLKVCNMLGGAV